MSQATGAPGATGPGASGATGRVTKNSSACTAWAQGWFESICRSQSINQTPEPTRHQQETGLENEILRDASFLLGEANGRLIEVFKPVIQVLSKPQPKETRLWK